MTIQTTWRHESPAITFAFRYPNGVVDEIAPVVKKRTNANNNRRVVLNGVIYKSIREASKMTKIPDAKIRSAVVKAKSRVVTVETEPPQDKPVLKRAASSRRKDLVINGVAYKGYSAAAKDLGVSSSTIKDRETKAGSTTFSMDITRSKIGVVIHGQTFDNCFQASKALGIPYTKVLRDAKQQLEQKAREAAEVAVEV
jgi:hypothetical protein